MVKYNLMLFWRVMARSLLDGTVEGDVQSEFPFVQDFVEVVRAVQEQWPISLDLDPRYIVVAICAYGAERFEWDPATRTLETVWVNKDVSYPNGIPSMSAATNLIYDVGQDILGGWTFEALDWDTGESVFSYRYGTSPMFNSAYAGTEILSGRCLYSGTMLGMGWMAS